MQFTITSTVPAIVILIALAIVAKMILRYSKFYNSAVPDINAVGSRFLSIDGLRGFLAIGVFFHHSIINFFYYESGKWAVPPSAFYAMCGQASVALFFMITGFLFWDKIIRSRENPNWARLYASRIFRLVPVYVASIMIIFLIASIKLEFNFGNNLTYIIKRFIISLSFNFLGRLPTIGDLDTGRINAYVVWSLKDEWIFYLSLPFLSLLLLNKSYSKYIKCILFLSIFILIGFEYKMMYFNFAFGMLSAYLVNRWHGVGFFKMKGFTIFPICAIGLLLYMFNSAHGLWQSILLFMFFICIVYDNTLFGLLVNRSFRMLGMISYSIYLFHGIIIYCLSEFVHTNLMPIQTLTASGYWFLIAIMAIFLLFLSSLSYALIEYPFIRMGKSFREWKADREYTTQGRPRIKNRV
ncbi:MAG: acyltransferase family protein [Syntrophobacteraceae bacterium]